MLQRTTTRIRELRKARGLTLQQLAEMVGTTAQTIQRLETDNMSVSVDWLQRIAPALGVAPPILLDGHNMERSARFLGNLDVDCIVRPGAKQNPTQSIPISVPGKDPVAVRLTSRLGPYDCGTLLVADRLDDDAFASADGRDCLVEISDGTILFRRIVYGRDGLTALVPYETARAIDRDLSIDWIAPIVMSVRYL